MVYLGPIEALVFRCQSAVIQAKEKIDPLVRVSPAHKKRPSSKAGPWKLHQNLSVIEVAVGAVDRLVWVV